VTPCSGKGTCNSGISGNGLCNCQGGYGENSMSTVLGSKRLLLTFCALLRWRSRRQLPVFGRDHLLRARSRADWRHLRLVRTTSLLPSLLFTLSRFCCLREPIGSARHLIVVVSVCLCSDAAHTGATCAGETGRQSAADALC
jgi:hypothetical protein